MQVLDLDKPITEKQRLQASLDILECHTAHQIQQHYNEDLDIIAHKLYAVDLAYSDQFGQMIVLAREHIKKHITTSLFVRTAHDHGCTFTLAPTGRLRFCPFCGVNLSLVTE